MGLWLWLLWLAGEQLCQFLRIFAVYIGHNMQTLTRIFFLLSIVLGLSAVSGCDRRSGVAGRIESVPNLVAYWDFADDDYLTSKGEVEATLRGEGEGVPTLVEEGPLSGRSLHFDGNDYLYIPYAQTSGLNVKSNQVTVVAWVKWTAEQIGFVGGMWNEYEDGGKRQYGLFVSLPHYNGANQVCGHISQTGKPTPPFPYSIDYSASKQRVPANEWCAVAFTYDGEYIRSYFNGQFEEREEELISHTKGFDGYPEGLRQVKNPYYFPDGIGDNGSDFTVGAVFVNKRIGNLFKGQIGGLAVYDRALSAEEVEYVSWWEKNLPETN